ncbi:MAG: CaiB/BaiF CoA transferase family protein [Acidimicrobiales bacterium]|jgi:crotonobetainyl-CoA:carnitine CoA-transferase CaiB-like acyl-CoA transferase
MPPILDDVRVLDFTQVLSGPTATRYLAELGADVIKVEIPPHGDITRNSSAMRDGRSGYFVNANRGKRSVCIDLKHPKGVELALGLAAGVDVVIENFSPGTIDRLGLGWSALSAQNERLIMCSISGFGQTGPLSHLPGYDGAAQAYAGLTSLNGDVDGTPVVTGAPFGDVITGINSVVGILGALFARERSGRGQHIETSVLEGYLQSHDMALESYSVSGGAVIQGRSGRFHQLACPYGIFQARDGFVFIAAAADKHWRDLCAAMQDTELLDPAHRWNVRTCREAESDELNARVDRWLGSVSSRAEGLKILELHRVPCGPVLGIDETADSPQLREAGVIREAGDPVLGSMLVPSFPLSFSDAEAGFDVEAPHLGEHNADLLVDLAGGNVEYDELVTSGVIHHVPMTTRPTKLRHTQSPESEAQ